MSTYLYKDFVKDLSKRFASELEAISAEYNFELGDEFEIALCDIFRRVLPTRYGICRGHIVSADGKSAGDDIIIYDQSRLPTLKLRRKDDYSRLENIPAEAVYCYIEAKHTLYLEGEARKSEQSLAHAWKQVQKAKTIISKRKPVPLEQIGPYRTLQGGISWSVSPYHPRIQNPAFGAIMCRHFKRNRASGTLNHSQEFKDFIENWQVPPGGPDFVGLGPNMFIQPYVVTESGSGYIPFRLPDRSKYHVLETKEIAFGLSLVSILSAIDRIELGVMPWVEILNDALNKQELLKSEA